MSDYQFNGPLARVLRTTLNSNQPNPWPPELDVAVRNEDAVPLCVNCLQPQENPLRHCCPLCGIPHGDYVGLDPYFQLLLIGDIMRKGVTGPPEKRLHVQLFLTLLSLIQYGIFAPVYWFWMIRRAIGKPIVMEKRPEPFNYNTSDLAD